MICTIKPHTMTPWSYTIKVTVIEQNLQHVFFLYRKQEQIHSIENKRINRCIDQNILTLSQLYGHSDIWTYGPTCRGSPKCQKHQRKLERINADFFLQNSVIHPQTTQDSWGKKFKNRSMLQPNGNAKNCLRKLKNELSGFFKNSKVEDNQRKKLFKT